MKQVATAFQPGSRRESDSNREPQSSPQSRCSDPCGLCSSSVFPFAAALGTPLYFHTELFIPIADSLRLVGIGVGAIVALIIAGARANVLEFILLSRLAARRLIAILVGYVFGVAVIRGLIAQTIVA
jgi:uncharacterized membrane protein YraQ (UPF0718 family)